MLFDERDRPLADKIQQLEAELTRLRTQLKEREKTDDPSRVAPLVGRDGQDLPQSDNQPLPVAASEDR